VPLDTDGQLALINQKLDTMLEWRDQQQQQMAEMVKWQHNHDLLHARGGGAGPISTPGGSGGIPEIVWKIIFGLVGVIGTLIATHATK
jgi:hypothetical protein